MSTAEPSSGAWSRKVWVWAVVLTALGLIGIWVDLFGSTIGSGGRITGGCGGGFGIVILLLLVLALTWGFVALVAAAGAFLLWRRSRWGPLLLIPINLLDLYLLGGAQDVSPGQLIWGAVVLVLTAVPASAVVLLVWPVMTRGRLWVRILELAILGALAVPVLLTAGPGAAANLNNAVHAAQPAPPSVVLVQGGCAGEPRLL